MFFDGFSYVVCPALSGCPESDAGALLGANGRAATWRHSLNVAAANEAIAARFGLDASACRVAALLHDVSAVIRPADMLLWVEARGLPLCEAERRHPFLLHQRLSQAVAASYFGVMDETVLSAIACHTTLRAGAASCDMALFIADKLAWDQEGEPPFRVAVESALNRSLEAACLAYMTYMEDSGRLLCPHDNWTAARRWLEKKGV